MQEPKTGTRPGGRPLQNMFAGVPRRYDLLNRLLTWGLDERWRRRAVDVCLRTGPTRVMDLCSGTGDLALHLAGVAREHVEVVAVDFSEPMLAEAKRKATRVPYGKLVRFVNADAAELPFPDKAFDVLAIAFGFRNLTFKNPARNRYLEEMVRVLRPGGRCVIVETSQPRSRALRLGFHLYLRSVVGPLGGRISGQKSAYRYLARSAQRYLRAQEVSALLIESGFRDVDFQSLAGGVAGIHEAFR